MRKIQELKHKRKRSGRLNIRFYLLLAVVLGALAYFLIPALAVTEGDNGTEQAPRPPQAANPTPSPPGRPIAPVDIEILRYYFDDISLTYFFYYEGMTLDAARHPVIDAEGLVHSIEYDPRRGGLKIRTYVPVVFTTRVGQYTENVYIFANNPRDFFDRIVIIDAGHGGYDTGAIVGDIRESDIVLTIAHMLYDMLHDSDSGIKAFMTRRDDYLVNNSKRVRFANVVGDLFLSVHTNAYPRLPSVAGTETLFSPAAAMYSYGNAGRVNTGGANFAAIVQYHLVTELGTRDRGIVERLDLYLNSMLIPAVFAEIDFKTNPEALENLINEGFQLRIAGALYRAIVEAFAL